MTEPPSTPVAFRPGDTMAYRSVTQEYVVTWTRDESGKWWPDDFIERGCTASDDDMLDQLRLDGAVHPDPADRVLTHRHSDDPGPTREWSYIDRQTGLTRDDVDEHGRLTYTTETQEAPDA